RSLVTQSLDGTQARGDLGRIDGGGHADDQPGGGDREDREHVHVDRQPVDVIDVRRDADPVGIGEQAGDEPEVDPDGGPHHADEEALHDEDAGHTGVGGAEGLEDGDLARLLDHHHDEVADDREGGDQDDDRQHQEHGDLL